MIVSVNVVLERTVGYNDVLTTCVEVIITFIILRYQLPADFSNIIFYMSPTAV